MTDRGNTIALLGLDIGTTSCKVVCYGATGERIAQASTSYALSHPRPGWAELDPADILDAVRQVLSEVAKALDGFDRLALAISAQGEAFVLVDGQGHALAPAPVSIDTRGLEAIATLKAARAAAKAAEAAGQELNALSSLAKLLWFRDAPDRPLDRADKALCVGEFVMRHLGLQPVIDYSMAARMGLLDVPKRTWSLALLAAANLSPDLLPPVAPSGRYVGTVPAERMASLGLDHPVEVYTGGHDQACAMLGAGVTDTETALYSVGTTEAIGVPVKEATADLTDLHIFPYPHVAEDRYVLLFGSQHGGRVLPWLADLLGQGGAALVLDDLPSGPSALTIVPHLAGSGTIRGDDQARAIIHGIGYDTTPESLIAAALEGVTMEQAVGLAQLAHRGFPVSRLRAAGGGTRSDFWMQLKADIMGLPIDCLDEPDTACAGAALLAGLGAGVFSSLEQAAARLVGIRRTFVPRADLHEVYALKRALHEETYRAMVGVRPLRQKVERAIARLADNREGRE